MQFLVTGVMIIVALIALAVIWWYYPPVRKPWGPTRKTYDYAMDICTTAGAEYPLKNTRIVINKSHRDLNLYDAEKIIKTYKIVLGTNPVEDKRKEGDGCTPEGEFYICTKNDRSRFHLFLGISYPNSEDAERGLRSRLINEEQYKRIISAIEDRKRPPWDTRLGGEIGIHGGGTGSDWTLGCIAMSDEDIEELFLLVEKGTPVTILKE